MNKKNIKWFLLVFTIFAGVFFSKYTYATTSDNGENTSQTFDATINVNFLNYDNSKWEFDNYDNLIELKVYDENRAPLNGLNYEYEWSNGQIGNGTTDNEGKISFKPSNLSASTMVKILFKNCTQRLIIEVSQIDESIIAKKIIYSNEYIYMGQTYIMADKNGSAQINLYKVAPPAIINIKFLHQDGSEWILNGNTKSPDFQIFNNRGHFEYEGYCNNNKNFKNDSSNVYFANNGQDENDTINGCSEIKLLVYGAEEQTKLKIDKSNKERFSKVIINGVEYEFVESYDDSSEEILNFKPGETINLEYYLPETATGTVGINSYDGSLSEDFVWNLHFDMIDHNGSNEDYTNAYWTFEGDDTIYRPTKVRNWSNDEYSFDIQIPFGKKVKLHNLPLHAMFHNGESFKYNYLSSGNKISTFFQSPLSGKTVITYKGENLTDEIIDKMGVYGSDTYYTSKSGVNDEPVHVDTSGSIKSFNMLDGFEINWYIFRNQTQIMFQKDYEEETDLEEKNKQFHFRVKLIDSWTKKPLSGKVAYVIYSNDEQVIDIETDVKYATLNSDGYIDIYLKAGEYAKLGKTLTDREISPKKLKGIYMSRDELYIKSNTEESISVRYFNDLGMLPCGVQYTIEEVDENYNCTVEKEGSESGISQHRYAGEISKVGYSAKQYYIDLDGCKFINNRKTGTLTIQKVVEGKETDEKFKFNIKIIDSATKFPLEYEYTTEDGNIEKIKFVIGENVIEDSIGCTEYKTTIELKAGEKITIKGLPAGAKYEVTETFESTEGYDTQMIGATGKIKPDDSEEKSIVKCLNKEIVIEDTNKNTENEEFKKEETKQEEIKQDEKNNPETGDKINVIIIVLVISMIILNTTIVIKKVKK